MHLLSIAFRRPDLPALTAAGLLWMLNAGVAVADTNTPPTIITQPASGIAGLGEDFAFSVVAAGTPPLSYQWRLGGTALSGATNSSLLLTNVSETDAGPYTVVVMNVAGSVISDVARFTVQTVFARRLATGRVLVNQSRQAAVPIVLRANGRENAVSFSLAYNTSVFANPVFLPGSTTGSVITNLARPGSVGVLIQLPPGMMFVPGYVTVGLVRFDLAAGFNALQGALAFTNDPVPITATNAAQQGLAISAAVQPQYILVASIPKLDRQSGLFKQQMIVSNPGASVMTNIDVLGLTLGVDSLTNSITFYNSTALLPDLPYADPIVQVDCNCGCGYALDSPSISCDFSNYLACATSATCALDSASTNVNPAVAQINYLLPAESRVLTLEFDVSDHVTVPPVSYSLTLADPLVLLLPGRVVPLTITTNRYVNGTFLVEFPTQLGMHYHIQYDSDPTLTNPFTAFPAVSGTGSQVQWIDDGPPKTISKPLSGSRFYRVLQSQ